MTPLFVQSRRRQIVLFNRGCELATGWTAADVTGKKAEFVNEADPHSVAALSAALAVPPHVWRGQPSSHVVTLPHRTAEPQPRLRLRLIGACPQSALPPCFGHIGIGDRF